MGQSWTKAHDASKNTFWENYPSIASPIIDTELNRNEVSVDTVDDRVITLDTTKAEQSDLLQAFKDVSLDSTTGVITFTLFNNTTKTIDTLLEKIAINFDYDDNPSSPHYQNLVIELKDGTYKYIDMSALITQYEFVNSTCISWTIGNDGSVTADIIDGSITGAKLQPNYLADCLSAKSGAENAEADAIAKALVAEGYANGKQNGVPVTSGSPYYENNAEYFKDQAQSIVGSKVDSFNGRTGIVLPASGDYSQDMIAVPTGSSNGQVPTVRTVGGVKTFVMEQASVGLLPHLIILSDTGSTVTATKGQTVISCTETSTGVFECDVPEFGTWVIDALLSGDDAQVSLVVDTVKVYTVDDSHFHADITVTFPDGGTCSCSKSGETTLYANTNPYTFTVHTSGTWTITATGNGETYTENVNVTTSEQTESLTIPVGSTVTPTDSVATLLSCAGINDSNITTLADLFADSTTLLAVISSNNAIDYLVRSTSFAKQDSVPKMTSNTTPSGEVSANTYYESQYPWLAFDGNNNTMWENTATTDGYICYKFTSVVKVVKANIIADYATSARVKNFIIQASNDGSTWTDLYTGQYPNTSGYNLEVNFNNTNNYLYYRLFVNDTYTGWIRVKTLQFYTEEGFCDDSTAMTYIGANNYASNTLLGNNTWLNAICNSTYFESVLNDKVPTMTSNILPNGECSAQSYFSSGYEAYRAFDGNDTNYWQSGADTGNSSWVQYKFDATNKIKCVKIINNANYNSYVGTLQASSDGNVFTDMKSNISVGTGQTVKVVVENLSNDSNLYYRMQTVQYNYAVGNGRTILNTIQFYCRKDV